MSNKEKTEKKRAEIKEVGRRVSWINMEKKKRGRVINTVNYCNILQTANPALICTFVKIWGKW